jgi:uncharacterized protein YkwD
VIRAAGIALVAVVAFVSGSLFVGQASAWEPETYSPADEALLYTLTNDARAGDGHDRLAVDDALAGLARWRAQDMADRDYFSHSIPGATDVFDALRAMGYCYSTAAENIARNNYPDDQTTAKAFEGWMNSSGYRAALMGDDEVTGIGAYEADNGEHYFVALYVVRCAAPTSGSTSTPRPTTGPTSPTPAPVPTPGPSQPPARPVEHPEPSACTP